MRIDVPDVIPPAEELGDVHFVGIGGAGLSAIARIMVERGISVSGSDSSDSALLRSLREAGATCYVGHDAAHLDGVDTVVVSTAVRETNPEVAAARARGLRLLPRSAGLQSVMCDRDVIAIAGTHGKTTTTSMLAMALDGCDAEASYAIGAEVEALGSNARDGSSRLFVAEADESDGAFLVYTPLFAVVTNVDADHLDNYGTESAYHEAFRTFLGRIRDGGALLAYADDAGSAALADEAERRGIETIRFGDHSWADVRLADLTIDSDRSSFVVWSRLSGTDERLGTVHLAVPGRHYAVDALGAIAAGLRCGFAFDDLVAGLSSYVGARRRMESVGASGEVRVYDSYAHHPVEIAGDLEAARALAGSGRLVVCYQPHLVSRTRIFGEAMGEELGAADEVVVTEIYLAREDPDPEVSSELVAGAVGLPPENVHRAHDLVAAVKTLASIARPGDLVLTLGAGDVTTVGPALLSVLRGRSNGRS
ncbi:UDP-N-acetylmuramate--L-alanine ligase [Solicola gregarius]|uniref:UDP-N-acetylmuramate--L-alanine ligase n=1 Tax=Solicola gregarius TaxID=2908642 RepID=A0AA46YM05_9ACTN|nr:UDP-N-acetylmuramate--L-alanine ligase [Solicola gregarius]UYM05353.1 UDP-N-acetylmuramate--L-alanine ligase [Solicola gregarius]